MLPDKLYWIFIFLLTIPLALYILVNAGYTQILLIEPMLFIASGFIKVFEISKEDLVSIINLVPTLIIGYIIFATLISVLFSFIANLNNTNDDKITSPWKYPLVMITTIIITFGIVMFLSYYKKDSYQKAVRNNEELNTLVTGIEGINISDLSYDGNIIKITFDQFPPYLKYQNMIMELNIRDERGNIIGYTPIKIEREGSHWIYKDLIFDEILKTENGKIALESYLYEDKKTIAKIISVSVKDATMTTTTFNEPLFATDVVIKNPKIIKN